MTMFTPFASLKPAHYALSSKLPTPLSSSNSVRFGMDRSPNGQDRDQISGKKRKHDIGNQPAANRNVRQANVQAQPPVRRINVPLMPEGVITNLMEFCGSDFWSLKALFRTAKSFSEIAGNSHYLRMAEARRLTSMIKNGAPLYELLLPLQLHSPQERIGVLDQVKQIRGNHPIKLPVIENLVEGMNHFTPAQQKKLLSAVKKMRSGDAYFLLGKGVKHLAPELRGQLVNRIIALPRDDWNKAIAIAVLGQGLEALSDAQREQLVTCAIAFPDQPHRIHLARAKAIVGLGQGMKALSDVQREQLVTCAIALPDGRPRAEAIAGLGQGLEALSDAQREQLVTCAIALPDVMHRAEAIAALGQGLEALSDAQREQLVTCAIALPNGVYRAEAIAGLGQGLKFLSDDQREQLMACAITLENERIQPGTIAALAQDLELFSDAQRERLVAWAITLSEEWLQGEAMGVLGQGLEFFSDAQRTKLVTHAIALPDSVFFERESKAHAFTGLAKGLQKLYEAALPSADPMVE